MNIDIMEELAELNRIQDMLVNGNLGICDKSYYRCRFRERVRVLKDHNVQVRCRKVRNQNKWLWKIVDTDNTNWVKFAPPCKFKNQCTTRAIFFCLEEKIPYNNIRKEQERNAYRKYEYGARWNTRQGWEPCLINRGYVRIVLKHTIRRDVLARMLKDCGRILTHSSHHCAAIMNGKVYDSWDSTRGRVDYVLVKKEYKNIVESLCCH